MPWLRTLGFGFSTGFCSTGFGFSGSGFFFRLRRRRRRWRLRLFDDELRHALAQRLRASCVRSARFGSSTMSIASSVAMISRMRSSFLNLRSLSSLERPGQLEAAEKRSQAHAHAPAPLRRSRWITASETLP